MQMNIYHHFGKDCYFSMVSFILQLNWQPFALRLQNIRFALRLQNIRFVLRLQNIRFVLRLQNIRFVLRLQNIRFALRLQNIRFALRLQNIRFEISGHYRLFQHGLLFMFISTVLRIQDVCQCTLILHTELMFLQFMTYFVVLVCHVPLRE